MRYKQLWDLAALPLLSKQQGSKNRDHIVMFVKRKAAVALFSEHSIKSNFSAFVPFFLLLQIHLVSALPKALSHISSLSISQQPSEGGMHTFTPQMRVGGHLACEPLLSISPCSPGSSCVMSVA